VPEVSRFYGIVILFFHNDHEPPHFHVRYGSAEAKVEILISRLLEGAIPRRAMRLVTEWTDLHRHELLGNWRRIRAGLEPRRIPPLP
jgi:hypothetical protein